MSRTFSPAQTAYLVARALVDTLRADFFATVPPCPSTDDRTVLDAYDDVYSNMREAMGVDAAERTLAIVEQALVDWCQGEALKVARTDEERANVEMVRTRGMKSLTYRPKLIDLAMRLAA